MRNLKKNKSTLEGGGRRVLEPLVPFGIKITLVDITGLFSEETKSIFGRLKKYTILWVRLGKRINFFYGRGWGGGGWRGLVQLSHLLGSKSQMIIGQKTGESAQYYGRVFRKEPTFGGGGS